MQSIEHVGPLVLEGLCACVCTKMSAQRCAEGARAHDRELMLENFHSSRWRCCGCCACQCTGFDCFFLCASLSPGLRVQVIKTCLRPERTYFTPFSHVGHVCYWVGFSWTFFSDTRRHLQVNNYDDDDDERTNEAPKNSSIDQQSAHIVYYL